MLYLLLYRYRRYPLRVLRLRKTESPCLGNWKSSNSKRATGSFPNNGAPVSPQRSDRDTVHPDPPNTSTTTHPHPHKHAHKHTYTSGQDTFFKTASLGRFLPAVKCCGTFYGYCCMLQTFTIFHTFHAAAASVCVCEVFGHTFLVPVLSGASHVLTRSPTLDVKVHSRMPPGGSQAFSTAGPGTQTDV